MIPSPVQSCCVVLCLSLYSACILLYSALSYTILFAVLPMIPSPVLLCCVVSLPILCMYPALFCLVLYHPYCCITYHTQSSSDLFSSLLFSSVLFCSDLFSSVLLYSVVICFLPFCFVLFCSDLFYSVLICPLLFWSVLFCFVLFCSIPFCSVRSIMFCHQDTNFKYLNYSLFNIEEFIPSGAIFLFLSFLLHFTMICK